jgi:hypothetical protein
MSMLPTAPQPPWSNDPPPPLRWQSWPAKERIFAGLAAGLGLASVALCVYGVTARAHLALVATAALALSLWRCFVPTSYELNPDGVNQWFLGQHRRIAWSAIQRYELGPKGVLLLPYADYCPMDALRGLYLAWGERRDDILAQLHYYLDRPIEI